MSEKKEVAFGGRKVEEDIPEPSTLLSGSGML
jgi:hypothetical protein